MKFSMKGRTFIAFFTAESPMLNQQLTNGRGSPNVYWMNEWMNIYWYLQGYYKWSTKIEENNRLGKTRDLFKKTRDTKRAFQASEKWKWSCSVLSGSLLSHGLQPTTLLCPWDFPGKSTGVGFHFLLQRIFPTQGLNPGLSHCKQDTLPSEPPGKSYLYRWGSLNIF